MSNIVKNLSKILLIILIVLICTATVANAGLETSEYDSELATAAKNATLGKSNNYFTFDAKKLVGKTVRAADAAGESSLAPYQRVGEFCIDNRASVGGASKYKVLNIIDITPEGKVISYTKDGKTIESKNKYVVNLLKQMSYIAKKSIEANEGKITGANCWKVAMQSTVNNGMGLMRTKLGLDKSFDVTIGTSSDVEEKISLARDNSKNKTYTGRFIFLYGNGDQNQIIFGAKEDEPKEILGNLKIVKNGANKKLSGVGFIIKNVDTNKYVLKDYPDKIAEYTADKTKAKEYTTNENGVINIKGLKTGKYELYETKNPHYGYVVDSSKAILVTIKNGDNKRQVVNEKLYVKLSGYVWIDKIAEKTAKRNDLFKENDYEYNDILLDGITVRLKDKQTGETVKETVTSNLGRYKDSRNNGHGEYLFEDVLIKKLSNYYIEFEYDGLTYTNVIPHIDKDNGSKAVEKATVRDNFNKDFSIVEGKTESTGITKNANGAQKHNLSYNIDKSAHTATLINNGQYIITANTDEAKYSIAEHYNGQEEIRYINLGLYEREKPDIAIIKDIENVRLTINGYEHTYLYAQRNVNAADYETGFNVGVKFGNEYGKLQYSRAVYKADYEYINEANKDKELKVYVTYKIAMKNQSTNLITKVNSIVDYYDNNYSIQVAGTAVDEKGNPVNDIKVSETQNYNDKYSKTIININKNIRAQSVENIYVQFALNREAVLKILNDGENLDNVAEINSYSVFDKDGKVYAGIDVDSNPGNAVPGDLTTYEDDTDKAPGLKLEVADAREMAGKVFLDSTSGELKTGEIRQGDGTYKDGEIGIKGVSITLTENSGSGKVYTGTTDANGDFIIKGFIPGDYTLRYTWGDETYTVQNYKGTIYNEQSRQNDVKWYKQTDPRYSDAIDNYQTRLAIDEELKIINKNTQATITKMDSTTPTMGIGVEYETTYTASTGDRYTYQIKHIDFGIVERARQDIELAKRVKTMKLTLANGQVVSNISIDDEGKMTGEKQYVTYMPPSEIAIPKNGYVKVELDNELIQGATLDVTYEIKVTNISELDYLSENYYKYGAIEGEVIKIETTGIIDYLDTQWAYEEQAEWQVKSLEEIRDKITDEVYNSESIKDRTILYTESLKGHKLEPTQFASVSLKVAKVLTNQDEVNLNNEAEVAEVVKNGGRDIISTPGNYIPGEEIREHDSDMAPEIIVTPHTGENQNLILPITVGLTAIMILGAGIVFIKKKVLNK